MLTDVIIFQDMNYRLEMRGNKRRARAGEIPSWDTGFAQSRRSRRDTQKLFASFAYFAALREPGDDPVTTALRQRT